MRAIILFLYIKYTRKTNIFKHFFSHLDIQQSLLSKIFLYNTAIMVLLASTEGFDKINSKLS